MTLFRVAVILFAFIPLYFGVTGTLSGGAPLAGGDLGAAAGPLDNQFRYLCGVYIGIAVMLFYSVGDVAGRAAVFRLAMLAVFIGGVSRMVSYLSVGNAAPWQESGMVVEMVTPVVLVLWQWMVLKASRNVIR